MFSLLTRISRRFSLLRGSAGFTMIELLIVISILGILAVAVLSAINPIEQINRGRDTGSRSDAEQLLSAIDRFHAFQGYYPWVVDAQEDYTLGDAGTVLQVNQDWTVGDCAIFDRLTEGAAGTTTSCTGTNELKLSFTNRVNDAPNPLYIYNAGGTGDSTYVCFVPASGAFKTEAIARCNGNLPDDFPPGICDTDSSGTTDEADDSMVCLP